MRQQIVVEGQPGAHGEPDARRRLVDADQPQRGQRPSQRASSKTSRTADPRRSRCASGRTGYAAGSGGSRRADATANGPRWPAAGPPRPRAPGASHQPSTARLDEEALLVGEVVEREPVRDPGLLGDVAERDLVVGPPPESSRLQPAAAPAGELRGAFVHTPTLRNARRTQEESMTPTDTAVDTQIPVSSLGGSGRVEHGDAACRLGTRCLLVERRPAVGTQPRAIGVRIRTMELFRLWGSTSGSRRTASRRGTVASWRGPTRWPVICRMLGATAESTWPRPIRRRRRRRSP